MSLDGAKLDVRADGQPQESRPGAYHDCYAFPRRTTRTYSALKRWSSRSASPEFRAVFPPRPPAALAMQEATNRLSELSGLQAWISHRSVPPELMDRAGNRLDQHRRRTEPTHLRR